MKGRTTSMDTRPDKPTPLRISLRRDLHRRVKINAIKNQANRRDLSSMGEIIAAAIAKWLDCGRPDLPMEEGGEAREGVQIVFRLCEPHLGQFTSAIIERLVENPTRRTGARLPHQETDAIVKWFVDEMEEGVKDAE